MGKQAWHEKHPASPTPAIPNLPSPSVLRPPQCATAQTFNAKLKLQVVLRSREENEKMASFFIHNCSMFSNQSGESDIRQLANMRQQSRQQVEFMTNEPWSETSVRR
jgi:hypothetical protein